MRNKTLLTLFMTLSAFPPLFAADAPENVLFLDIPTVVSASRIPERQDRAPATVYVLTGDEIKASGVQNLWDALRMVPGVDVMSPRASQGEVGIRGGNQSFNNRVLVLLDGKTLLNGIYDFVAWKNIPVSLGEIDRIEVVEGAASALYGANAQGGVINIITKRPEQLRGGSVSYGVGEQKTQGGSMVYGDKKGPLGYKVDAAWNTANQFEHPDLPSVDVNKFHGMLSYEPTEDSEVAFSGALVNSSVEINDGLDAPWFLDGPSGFARVDARVGQTKFRSFWNNERQDFRGFPGGTLQGINFNAYDASLEHSLSLPFQNALTLGASYRRNVARAPFFGKPVTQDLWAVFFENQWRPVDRWTLVASGRLDRHPLTDYTFSPRGSIIFQPEERQTLRLSAGSSFRNPTLAENHLRLLEPTPNPGTDVPNPPYSTLQFDVLGDRGLEPEKMTVVELAHMGRFGRFRTTTAAYRYVLSNMIHNTSLSAVSVVPPTMELMTSFGNGGSMKAWGGEFGVDFLAGKGVTCFANYSYVSLKSDQSSSNLGNLALSTPRHKINGGIRFAGAGWRANLWADWVDEVFWGNTSITAPANDRRVPAYTLLNGRISYMFSGHLRGLELGVNAFNFANKKHYEFDSQSYGEIIKARWMATASYRF